MNGQTFWVYFFLISLAVWAVCRAAKIFDKDGKIKNAAQDGAADWITRFFKK